MIEWRRGKYARGNEWPTLWHRVEGGRAVCGIRRPVADVEHYRSDSLYPGDVCEKCDAAPDSPTASQTEHSA